MLQKNVCEADFFALDDRGELIAGEGLVTPPCPAAFCGGREERGGVDRLLSVLHCAIRRRVCAVWLHVFTSTHGEEPGGVFFLVYIINLVFSHTRAHV